MNSGFIQVWYKCSLLGVLSKDMAFSTSCSFGPIVGTGCSFDRKDRTRSADIILFSECKKDITNHKSTWAFSGVESEEELILARAGIFYAKPQDRSTLNICPYHRSELGIGWRRGKNICRVPEVLATHKTIKKGDRGIGKEASRVIFQKTDVLIPVGSGNFALFTLVTSNK